MARSRSWIWADLDWANEMALTCPVNKLGTVTIWQADRHGSLHGELRGDP